MYICKKQHLFQQHEEKFENGPETFPFHLLSYLHVAAFIFSIFIFIRL